MPESSDKRGVQTGVRSEKKAVRFRKKGGIVSAINKLNQNDVRRHIAKGSGGKLSDGGGLFLQVSKAGTPLWRVKYTYAR